MATDPTPPPSPEGGGGQRAMFTLLRNERCTFESDATAMAMLDAMPGPAMVLNSRRQVVLVNRRLRRAMELADVELSVGGLPGDVLACRHAATGPAHCGSTESCELCGANRAIRDCLSTGDAVTRECRIQSLRPENGGALDFRSHAAIVEVFGVKFLILALEDISSEKRRQILERTFFHDLMNTCGGIQGLAEVLADSGDATLDAEIQADLRRLAGHAIDQIASQRQLLAAERGELAVRVHPVELQPFLDEIVALYRHHDVADGRIIRLDLANPGTFETDPVLLGRVVGNLLKNALEATRQGNTVVVRGEHLATETSISVHNPELIPRDIQLQLFQRSFSTKGGEGRGVGTYSVRLFAEQYLRGKVGFESVPGAGTSFRVVIPNRFPAARAAA
jgi:signal transduction histidine kinase